MGVGPPIPYCPHGGLESVMLGLQSVAVKLFFHFLVTYSARLIFHFCVADLKAIQNVQNQPVPLFGRRIYFQNVRAFIFERVLFIPLEASKECLKCFLFFQPKKKKTYICKFQLKLTKYKFCHCLFNLGFCIMHKIQNSLFRFKSFSIYLSLGIFIFPTLITKCLAIPGFYI